MPRARRRQQLHQCSRVHPRFKDLAELCQAVGAANLPCAVSQPPSFYNQVAARRAAAAPAPQVDPLWACIWRSPSSRQNEVLEYEPDFYASRWDLCTSMDKRVIALRTLVQHFVIMKAREEILVPANQRKPETPRSLARLAFDAATLDPTPDSICVSGRLILLRLIGDLDRHVDGLRRRAKNKGKAPKNRPAPAEELPTQNVSSTRWGQNALDFESMLNRLRATAEAGPGPVEHNPDFAEELVEVRLKLGGRGHPASDQDYFDDLDKVIDAVRSVLHDYKNAVAVVGAHLAPRLVLAHGPPGFAGRQADQGPALAVPLPLPLHEHISSHPDKLAIRTWTAPAPGSLHPMLQAMGAVPASEWLPALLHRRFCEHLRFTDQQQAFGAPVSREMFGLTASDKRPEQCLRFFLCCSVLDDAHAPGCTGQCRLFYYLARRNNAIARSVNHHWCTRAIQAVSGQIQNMGRPLSSASAEDLLDKESTSTRPEFATRLSQAARDLEQAEEETARVQALYGPCHVCGHLLPPPHVPFRHLANVFDKFPTKVECQECRKAMHDVCALVSPSKPGQFICSDCDMVFAEAEERKLRVMELELDSARTEFERVRKSHERQCEAMERKRKAQQELVDRAHKRHRPNDSS